MTPYVPGKLGAVTPEERERLLLTMPYEAYVVVQPYPRSVRHELVYWGPGELMARMLARGAVEEGKAVFAYVQKNGVTVSYHGPASWPPVADG